jgi:hypothetical protein
MATFKEHAFALVDVQKRTIKPSADHLAQIKEVGWTGFAYYEEQRELSFAICRATSGGGSDGSVIIHAGEGKSNSRKPSESASPPARLDLCKHANAIRRYINARTEVCILDFIPNHEQPGSARHVLNEGDTCLISEIRIALNGVVCRQVRGAIYKLHAANDTPYDMDIMTEHITLADAKADDPWHNNFPPTIKLGVLKPGAELHISLVTMKPGYSYTNIRTAIVNGEVVPPPDRPYFMHNGFVKYMQPDMLDGNGVLLPGRDPLKDAPGIIIMGFHPQPYVDPSDIFVRALDQLAEDFGYIAGHIAKAKAVIGVSLAHESEPETEYASEDVVIKVVPSAGKPNMQDLICTVRGPDVSLGVVSASNAGYLSASRPDAYGQCTHYTCHMTHPLEKEFVVRVTSRDALKLLEDAVGLAIFRTQSLREQFMKA